MVLYRVLFIVFFNDFRLFGEMSELQPSSWFCVHKQMMTFDHFQLQCVIYGKDLRNLTDGEKRLELDFNEIAVDIPQDFWIGSGFCKAVHNSKISTATKFVEPVISYFLKFSDPICYSTQLFLNTRSCFNPGHKLYYSDDIYSGFANLLPNCFTMLFGWSQLEKHSFNFFFWFVFCRQRITIRRISTLFWWDCPLVTLAVRSLIPIVRCLLLNMFHFSLWTFARQNFNLTSCRLSVKLTKINLNSLLLWTVTDFM